MSTVRERAAENAASITSMLIVGLGLVALFAEIESFWLIWVIGFTVVMPIVSMLFGEDEDERESTTEPSRDETRPRTDHTSTDDSTTDALDTLRERYARGELTDEQFEHKLDRLFETETPESAAEWREREREPIEE